MKWIADLEEKKLHLEIKLDEYAGYYLYIWVDGKDTYDYLQDTLEIAMRQAERDFGVPLETWKQVE